nr:hypothetical protein Iba_chr02eCG5950 [Ipomoea batatas]
MPVAYKGKPSGFWLVAGKAMFYAVIVALFSEESGKQKNIYQKWLYPKHGCKDRRPMGIVCFQPVKDRPALMTHFGRSIGRNLEAAITAVIIAACFLHLKIWVTFARFSAKVLFMYFLYAFLVIELIVINKI